MKGTKVGRREDGGGGGDGGGDGEGDGGGHPALPRRPHQVKAPVDVVEGQVAVEELPIRPLHRDFGRESKDLTIG